MPSLRGLRWRRLLVLFHHVFSDFSVYWWEE
jgi:hypothetical protein